MNKELPSSYFTNCSSTNNKGTLVFDHGSFIESLIFSKKLIFQSNFFKELPDIIRGVGGPEGLKQLIESNSLAIHYDALTFGEIGQTAIPSRIAKGLLPNGSFAFSTVQVNKQSYESTVEKSLLELKKQLGYGRNKFDSLKNLIIDTLTNFQGDDAKTQIILEHFDNDLGNLTNLIRHAIPLVLKERGNQEVNSTDIELELEKLDDYEYRSQSNLKQLLDLDPLREHEIIKRAGLKVGGLNVALFTQDYYDATIDLNNNQQSILEHHLSYLKKLCQLNGQPELGKSVKEVVDIPQFDSSTIVDVEKLLALKDTAEYREFISVINSSNATDRKELKDRVDSFKARASNFLNIKTVKSLRYIIPSLIGLVSHPVTMATGLALGAIDHFLLEKFLPRDNIAFFIKKDLPSVFIRDE